MQVSTAGVQLIKSFEGFRATSYRDSAGIWTIGYGTICYKDGSKVRNGQSITEAMAEELLMWEIGLKTAVINHVVTSAINQNQYDALTSFTYNVGEGALKSSSLLKLVNANPNATFIRAGFTAWDKIHVDGALVTNQGLLNRRIKEADLYFS